MYALNMLISFFHFIWNEARKKINSGNETKTLAVQRGWLAHEIDESIANCKTQNMKIVKIGMCVVSIEMQKKSQNDNRAKAKARAI